MKISNDSQIIPAKLKYLDNSALVVLDNKMEIHMMLPTKDWIKVEASEKQNYVAIEVFKNRLFLAGKSSITVFDFSEKLATLQQTTNIQIEAMLPVAISLDYLRAIHAVSREVVVVSDASGLCIVVNVAENKILNILQIPKSAEPWTTAVRRYDWMPLNFIYNHTIHWSKFKSLFGYLGLRMLGWLQTELEICLSMKITARII